MAGDSGGERSLGSHIKRGLVPRRFPIQNLKGLPEGGPVKASVCKLVPL